MFKNQKDLSLTIQICLVYCLQFWVKW